MKIEDQQLIQRIFEAALMAVDKPLQRKDLVALFDELEKPEDELIDNAISSLEEQCEERGYELKRVASGYRFQVKQDLSRWVSKLWQERAPRYTRALLETLSLIAYRQPITRGEIEEVRGVAVSTQIIKTLLERNWVKVVGHRDAPGRPSIYATTKEFLDYFNLKSLDQLPSLSEIRDLSEIGKDYDIELPLDLVESANDELAESSEEASETEALDEENEISDQITDENTEQVGEALGEQQAPEPELADAERDEGEQADSVDEALSADEAENDIEETAVFESWIENELDQEQADVGVIDHSPEQEDSHEHESSLEQEDNPEHAQDKSLEMQASPNDDQAQGGYSV